MCIFHFILTRNDDIPSLYYHSRHHLRVHILRAGPEVSPQSRMLLWSNFRLTALFAFTAQYRVDQMHEDLLLLPQSSRKLCNH
jgi:hypothetical protein